jgi:hypothetical protein
VLSPLGWTRNYSCKCYLCFDLWLILLSFVFEEYGGVFDFTSAWCNAWRFGAKCFYTVWGRMVPYALMREWCPRFHSDPRCFACIWYRTILPQLWGKTVFFGTLIKIFLVFFQLYIHISLSHLICS